MVKLARHVIKTSGCMNFELCFTMIPLSKTVQHKNKLWPHASICPGLSSRQLLISIAAEAQIQIQMQQHLPWRIACNDEEPLE